MAGFGSVQQVRRLVVLLPLPVRRTGFFAFFDYKRPATLPQNQNPCESAIHQPRG